MPLSDDGQNVNIILGALIFRTPLIFQGDWGSATLDDDSGPQKPMICEIVSPKPALAA